MPEVKITAISRVPNPKPNKAGSIILAYFGCEVGGFRFHGCALARTEKFGLTVWPPMIEGAAGRVGSLRAIDIIDDATRHAMMQAARTAYKAIGGTDAEWIPTRIRPTDPPKETKDWP